jgi:hypothetical protein
VLGGGGARIPKPPGGFSTRLAKNNRYITTVLRKKKESKGPLLTVVFIRSTVVPLQCVHQAPGAVYLGSLHADPRRSTSLSLSVFYALHSTDTAHTHTHTLSLSLFVWLLAFRLAGKRVSVLFLFFAQHMPSPSQTNPFVVAGRAVKGPLRNGTVCIICVEGEGPLRLRLRGPHVVSYPKKVSRLTSRVSSLSAIEFSTKGGKGELAFPGSTSHPPHVNPRSVSVESQAQQAGR